MPPRSRTFRALLACATLAISTAVIAGTATPANAAVLGTVALTPVTGTDSTLFSGVVADAQCPAGTVDSFFDVKGDDIGTLDGQTTSGSGDLGFLGTGNSTGTGRREFAGASIANLQTTNSGSFTGNGTYVVRFVCIDGAGAVSDTYETPFTYQDTSNGAYDATPAPVVDGATYTPVTPKRLLDTRSSSQVPALGTRVLTVRGGTTTVAPNASAVALNVTALPSSAANGGKGGFLSVAPAKTTTSSNLNYVAGKAIPNLVISRVSNTGTVTIYNGGQSAVHVLADIQGYFTDDTSGTTYSPLAPKRLLDTRSTTKVPALGTVVVAVTGGTTTVPTGAAAVALNVTALPSSAANGGKGGFLSAGPAKTTTSSNLNYVAGQAIANLVISKVSAAGTVTIYNGGQSAVHVLADVQGYFGPGTDTSGYESLVPKRLLDTRSTARIPAKGSLDLVVTGGSTTVPSSVAAVALNVTVLSPSPANGGTGGFLSVAPAKSTTTSNINFTASQAIPNLVISKVSPTGKVTIYNGGAGPVDVFADVQGYFTVAP